MTYSSDISPVGWYIATYQLRFVGEGAGVPGLGYLVKFAAACAAFHITETPKPGSKVASTTARVALILQVMT
jgi:hypothetical protein